MPNEKICSGCNYLDLCRGCYFGGLTASKLFDVKECRYIENFFKLLQDVGIKVDAEKD